MKYSPRSKLQEKEKTTKKHDKKFERKKNILGNLEDKDDIIERFIDEGMFEARIN